MNWKCYCDISTRTFFNVWTLPPNFIAFTIVTAVFVFFNVQHSKNKATILLQQLHFLFAHLQIANSFLCSDNFPGFCCLTNNCTPILLLAGWLFAALLLTVKKLIVSSLDSEFDCNWKRYGRRRWKNEQKEGIKRRELNAIKMKRCEDENTDEKFKWEERNEDEK